MEAVHLTNPLPSNRSHHSFVNAVHVVHVQLQLLERVAGRRGVFRRDLKLCDDATGASKQGAVRDSEGRPIERFGSTIVADIHDPAMELVRSDGPVAGETIEVVDILSKGLLLTDMRLQELLFEQSTELDWQHTSVADFVAEVQDSLSLLCIDRRWTVTYTKDDHDEQSHLVELSVTTRSVDRLSVPTVLARFLAYLAHASILRTKPGGRLAVAVVDEGENISATVRDTGRAIALEGLNERLKGLVASGDPHAEGAHAVDAPLATIASFATRAGGRCVVEVRPSSESMVRITVPRKASGEWS